jgi:ribosomal protein S8
MKATEIAIINRYNISVRKKSMNINTRYTNSCVNLVKKLYSLGIISSFNIRKAKFITIYPTYFRSKPFVVGIKAVSRGNKTFTISLKGINLLKRISYGSTIVITSNKGLLTLDESIASKTGGKIALIAI